MASDGLKQALGWGIWDRVQRHCLSCVALAKHSTLRQMQPSPKFGICFHCNAPATNITQNTWRTEWPRVLDPAIMTLAWAPRRPRHQEGDEGFLLFKIPLTSVLSALSKPPLPRLVHQTDLLRFCVCPPTPKRDLIGV